MEFILQRALLPDNKMLRRKLLDEYFPCNLIPFEELINNQWRIRTFIPNDFSYYIDPQLRKSLENWPEFVNLESLGSYWRFYKNGMISFNDSWSLFYWSLLFKWLDSQGIPTTKFTLLHIDDHVDMASPLLISQESSFECIFSHREVNFSNPESIQQALERKSIDIGSFITPLIHAIDFGHVFHWRLAHQGPSLHKTLSRATQIDTLLAPDKKRPSITFDKEKPANYKFSVASTLPDLHDITHGSSFLLLHIDCDAFNNRYNGDANWNPLRASIDLNLDQIKPKIHHLLEQVSRLKIPVFMNVALSPGFFPSEYWKETCNLIFEEAENYGIIREDDFSKYLKEFYPNQIFKKKFI